MIGDKTPNMRKPDCEWKRKETPAWTCPYTGLIEVKGKMYCAQHAQLAAEEK